MPFLFVLPIVGVVVLVACVARSNISGKSSAHAPGAGPPTHQFELDRGMPEDLVHEVLMALVQESDGTKLEALARALAAQYPMAAGELRAKLSSLAGSKPAALRPSSSRSSQPDMSETAVVLQAAMRAFAQETDPVELQGFATSLRERYPTASLLLAAKAHDLSGVAPPPAAVASLPSAAAGVTMAASAQAPSTYEVHSGDTPARIAEKVTGDTKRWPELVEANPSKPRLQDGNFASLAPGEKLALPASWSSPIAAHVAPQVPAHLAEAHA